MSAVDRARSENENWRRYHIASCSPCYTVKKDVVRFHMANDDEHELLKARVCLDLQRQGHHFIVEAERNAKNDDGSRKVVDVVDLTTGEEIEIVHAHESKKDVEEYRKKGVLVIMTDFAKKRLKHGEGS